MPGSHQNRLKDIWPRSLREELDEDQSDSWRDTATRLEKDLEHRMGDYPKLTLAAAATLGFVLGWMVKRK
jgi:hypothetical protein